MGSSSSSSSKDTSTTNSIESNITENSILPEKALKTLKEGITHGLKGGSLNLSYKWDDSFHSIYFSFFVYHLIMKTT